MGSLAPACAALVLVLLIAGCGRSFRSCAAYIGTLGPIALTVVCPPHGFVGTETEPDDTTTLKEQP